MSKYKTFFTFAIILILASIGVSAKRRLGNEAVKWEKYKDDGCGYEIIYPSHWVIKTTQYRDPCETPPEAKKCIPGSGLYLRNRNPSELFKIKKMLFNKPPGDISPGDQTSFNITCSQTKFSTIEDWVKRSWLSSNNDASFEKETLEKITEIEFGVTKVKVFVASESRLHFIYSGHEYEISYESGSEEQLLKDEKTLNEILRSFKIL